MILGDSNGPEKKERKASRRRRTAGRTRRPQALAHQQRVMDPRDQGQRERLQKQQKLLEVYETERKEKHEQETRRKAAQQQEQQCAELLRSDLMRGHR